MAQALLDDLGMYTLPQHEGGLGVADLGDGPGQPRRLVILAKA